MIFSELNPDSFSAVVNRERSFLLRYTSIGLTRLFWNIGKSINKCPSLKQTDDEKLSAIKILSENLFHSFGSYFNQESLLLMSQFADKFPEFESQSESECITWDHIKLLLAIVNDEKRNFFTNQSIEKLLSADQLAKSITAGQHSGKLNTDNSTKIGTPDIDRMTMLEQSKHLRPVLMNSSFKELLFPIKKLAGKVRRNERTLEILQELTDQINVLIESFNNAVKKTLARTIDGVKWNVGCFVRAKLATIIGLENKEKVLDRISIELLEEFGKTLPPEYLNEAAIFAHIYSSKNAAQKYDEFAFATSLNSTEAEIDLIYLKKSDPSDIVQYEILQDPILLFLS
ncbi:DUF1016 domain-containing protein [Sediminibacterium roseum]|uniref:DUF1016 domain-containing protein n=1 Tax=Sediminibacterium roseum TaxID=1978412 RepID=A0ABW9ZVE7_9BACT|nr:DUF1016 N-terminal domain-containing protein [Sediminibacterium roseum]NCI49193.1 DUF1016 domain-containing protein [Sediminibacterium roseum]